MIIRLKATMVSVKHGFLNPVSERDIYINGDSISRFLEKEEGTLITLVDGFKTVVSEKPYEIYCKLNGIQDPTKAAY